MAERMTSQKAPVRVVHCRKAWCSWIRRLRLLTLKQHILSAKKALQPMESDRTQGMVEAQGRERYVRLQD